MRLLPVDERVRRAREMQALHSQWIAEQLTAGVDGPVPDDRTNRESSDYNLHATMMDAPAEAQDRFFRRLNEILSDGPATD